VTAEFIECGITWLASYPKSGNTMLRLFLSHYLYGNSNINNTGPLNFKDSGEWAFQMVSPKAIQDLTFYDCLALKPAALLNLLPVLASFDRQYMFLKTHSPNVVIDGFAQCPRGMTAAAVYVVRDPRDVVVSFSHYMRDKTVDGAVEDMFATNNTLGGVGDIRQYLGPWPNHVASWADKKGVHTIRYEDMIEDPKTVFRGVLEYLKADIDEDRLEESARFVSFENLQKIERDSGFKDNPHEDKPFFRTGRAGQWRDALTEEQVAKIEDGADEVMRRFGYELTTC